MQCSSKQYVDPLKGGQHKYDMTEAGLKSNVKLKAKVNKFMQKTGLSPRSC